MKSQLVTAASRACSVAMSPALPSTLSSGQNGTDIFFQNELPYDPPSQAAWMASPTRWVSAFVVTPNVTSFHGYGMASYIVFIQTTATLYEAEAIEAPTTAQVQFQDTVVAVWLGGSGGDLSIIDGAGGPCTSTNPGKIGQAVDLNSYP